jgi:hypothetical protein
MSLLLLLGRILFVRRFVTSNSKEEDRQQLKFLFLLILKTLKSEAVIIKKAFWFVYVNVCKRLKVWP